MNKKRVLIIDDDYNTAKTVKETLQDKGLTVFYGSNEEEGLKLLSEVKPDIILLDLVLPGESGFKIAQDIKANPKYVDIPIIAISLKTEDIDKHIAAKSGFIAYMEKPLDINRLLFTINDILNK
ncbi:MAG: response regulator [Candidatus Omnitrophica bacterium]|nr:response regulator [Candidatus Omnitrophota bacterium]